MTWHVADCVTKVFVPLVAASANLNPVLILAIDTATPTLVTGIVDTRTDTIADTTVDTTTTRAERTIPNCREQEERLVPSIQECLDEAQLTFADLDGIVVGCGPGPFTGLRVGMAAAAALGDALGIPVFGVCSLDAIAARIDAASVLVTTDARRREVYWASYVDGNRVAGPEVQKPEELVVRAQVVNVPAHLSDKLPVAGQRVDLDPTPASLVLAADLDSEPQPLVPLYLRRPDVKEPKPKPISPAVPDVEL